MGSLDVSVVIAAKNETLHVEEAVRSVITQQGLSFELVFVDDGSTDDTYQKVEIIAARYSNIRIFRNPKSGKCSAFNYGVTQARGRFVAIFAGDDIMPQGSLATRFAAIECEPETVPVVGLCKLELMSDRPSENGTIVPKTPGRGIYSGVSYLFSRAAVAKAFPVPEQFPNEDTFLELSVLHLGMKQVHNDVVGCRWRIHSGNSINLRLGFQEFNSKLTRRMEVISVFYERFRDQMDEGNQGVVQGKIALEKHRSNGKMLRVLLSQTPVKDRLRALAYTNGFFYGVRQRFYSILSGL